MLTINCINITDINDENFQLLRCAVSEERRIKADRFHFIDDSKRCICAELLLQYSLLQSVGRFVELDINYNEFGKPFMNNMKGFFYNLSHSGKWVAIAYGRTEVGIDIEKIQIGKEDIANKFFSKDEKCFIFERGKEQEKRFTQIWTLKESYIKYLGTGLSTSLDSFSVNTVNGNVTNYNGEIQKHIKLKSYPFDTDYYLSVCSADEEVIIHIIMMEDLIQFINKKKKSFLVNDTSLFQTRNVFT